MNENKNNRSYAGIGARNTPDKILDQMRELANRLSAHDYILRTGGARGADTAFIKGAMAHSCEGRMEIYVPSARLIYSHWQGANISYFEPSNDAYLLTSKYHPTWNLLDDVSKSYHARNAEIVLGPDLKTPVDFVICYHRERGGTMQAVRIALTNGIRVFNLRHRGVYSDLLTSVDFIS